MPGKCHYTFFVKSEIPVNHDVDKIAKCKEHSKIPYFEENRSI